MILSAVLAWTLGVPQRTATELPRPGSAVRALNVAGVLPAWRFPQYTPARSEGLTDLIVFSVQPTAKGEVDLIDLSSSALDSIRRAKAAQKFRLWLTVGGWGRSSGFAATAANPELRKNFISELSFFVTKEGFDGVDFDWEHPKNAKEQADYALLIAEAKAHFEPKKKFVSTTVPSWLELPKSIWKDVDRIHLVSYDYEGRHSTFEQAKRDADFLIKKGAPAWKLHLGVPLYGRKITEKGQGQALGIAEIIRQFNPKPEVDEAGGYFFNGPETLKNKVSLAREMNLGGIFAWEIGQDSSVAENSMLRQILNAARPTSATQLRPDPKPAPATGRQSGKGEKANKPSRSTKSSKAANSSQKTKSTKSAKSANTSSAKKPTTGKKPA